MKKRGKKMFDFITPRALLLMPSQMNVLAADAQEDSSSVQAVEEAVPDRENATTIDEIRLTIRLTIRCRMTRILQYLQIIILLQVRYCKNISEIQ